MQSEVMFAFLQSPGTSSAYYGQAKIIEWPHNHICQNSWVHPTRARVVCSADPCSPEVQGCELAACPPCCPHDLELHHSMVTAAKAAFNLPCRWEKAGLSSMHSTNLLTFLHLPVSSLQLTPGWLNFPSRTRACEHVAAPTCL